MVQHVIKYVLEKNVYFSVINCINVNEVKSIDGFVQIFYISTDFYFGLYVLPIINKGVLSNSSYAWEFVIPAGRDCKLRIIWLKIIHEIKRELREFCSSRLTLKKY